jgi:signal transduction histidine kinase
MFGWLVVAFLLIGVVPLGMLGVFGMPKTLELLQDNMVKSLKSSTDWQVEQINKNFSTVVSHVYFLAELPSLKRHLSGTSSSLKDLESDILEFSRGHPYYGKIRVIGVSGHEVARAIHKNNKLFMTSSKELEFVGNSQHFQDLFNLSKGDIYLSPINVDPGREFLKQQIIEVITPVYKGDTKLGLIMACLYASRLFDWIHLPNAPFMSLLLDSKGKILHLHEHTSSINTPIDIEPGRLISEVFLLPEKDGNHPVVEGINYLEDGTLVVRPIPLSNGLNSTGSPNWYIAAFFPESYLDVYMASSSWYLALGIFTVALASLTAAVFITRRFKKSFHLLNEGMENIASGKFDERLQLGSGDEFENTANKMNRMRSQLKEKYDELTDQNKEVKSRLKYYKREVHSLEHQLYRADKLASVGELSLKLAHEIGNPLASIKTVTQMMSEKINGKEVKREYFEKIVSEVDRLTIFLKKFNSLAVMKERQLAPCDLGNVIKDVNFFLKVQAMEKGVSIEENFQNGSTRVLADLQQIKQLLMNLILNSIQATGPAGRIRVAVSDSDTPCDYCYLRKNCFCKNDSLLQRDKGLVELSVCDTGMGIKKSDLMKIFNPFYTTKPNGTGLGLSIAHKIVENHNGTIRAYSMEGDGTTFKVYFPKHVESLMPCPED